MRIAILDDYHKLFQKHVPAELRGRAEFVEFADTLPASDEDAVAARLEPFEVISTMRERTPFTASLLGKLPKLKILLTTGMRNKGIDMDAARDRGIIVAGTPVKDTPGPAATVQHTWALILALANNIGRDDALVAAGSWGGASPLNTYLGGATLGILGLGKLGTDVAKIGVLFGMRVIAWSQNLDQERADAAAEKAGLPRGTFKAVSKDELFATSDVLSLHCLLSSRSRGIVGAEDLAKMKPSSFLINTSRGPLVGEDDLLDVLDRGVIRGAGLDVFDVEPLPADSRWRTTKWGQDGRSIVIRTPHTGYAFDDVLEWMWQHTAINLERVVDGLEPLDRLV